MIGQIYPKQASRSLYQPSREVTDLTSSVKKDYSIGSEIIHKDWEELNNYSVVERMNRDQRTFNSYVDETVEDPNEAWKWKGTRSLARNRTMAMHAHVTANYIVPLTYAQKETQEEDRDLSGAMRDVLEWMSVNSNYRQSFLLATMGMLVNPVTYLGAEYCEVFQKIREKTDQGYEVKEILDEVLSGFQATVYSADQVLITNAYEQNIQKQRKILKRRYIEYAEAEAKYGGHEYFSFVNPGIKSIYNDEDGLFYDVKDEDHPTLVEEVIALCRRDDYEVPFVNGIYLGNEDIEGNPIKHRDNRNAPKYNVTPFGYERINEHFFYYKSLINRIGWDDQLMDALYAVGMNKLILDTLMPVIVTGEENVDTQVVFPGKVTAFANSETKASPLLPASNLGNLFSGMKMIEDSVAEASLSEVQLGALPEASQKASTVARAEQNARILLSGVGKSIGLSVAAYGQLMIDIALQHLTVGQLDEVTNALQYRSFLVKDQIVDGKKVSKLLRFDESLMGRKMSKSEQERREYQLLNESGYPNTPEHIYDINPHLFSKLQYLSYVDPEALQLKNDAFQQALLTELYQLVRQDPLVEPEALVRKLMYSFFKNDAEELIAKQQMLQPQDIQGVLGGGQMGNIAKSKALQGALQGTA
jgi:hypothetical protein